MSKKIKKDTKESFDTSKYYPLVFTILFVVILFQYSFSSLEAIFYDFRVRFDFGMSFKENIVLVTLDEDSDEFLGERYPYTYATHERFLAKIIKDDPSIINYIVNLNEPESRREIQHLSNFKKRIDDFVKLNGGAFRFGTDMDDWGENLPPNDLREVGYSLAAVHRDNLVFAKDGVVRRAILTISGEESLHLWTANTYREMNGQSRLNVNDVFGSYFYPEADASFSLFKYYTSTKENNGRIKKIPFHRVLVGNFPKGFFTNKIVIVSGSYISNSGDYVQSPFNSGDDKSPRINIHSQIIQSFLQNKTIYKVPEYIIYSLSIIIAVVLSIIISMVRPTQGLFITVSVLAGILIISHILFSIMGLWVYVTHLALTVFAVYYIWVPFRAIGEYQRRYALQEESRAIEKVENLKRNFISLMSHDLKTPVAKIAGMADVLLQKYRTDNVLQENLTAIIDSTKELNQFITSILDLTKIESRKLNIKKVSKDINPIIENIVKGLRYEAANKNITLTLEQEPLYPISVDLELIKRVISNLVENAIKYSGKDTEVNVKTWDDTKWVYVEIRDNGVGIAEVDLEHIFDKFYRVKNDASHSIKGTGLGLYLVKYFVELHGGKISVSSEVNSGTMFQVKLKNG